MKDHFEKVLMCRMECKQMCEMEKINCGRFAEVNVLMSFSRQHTFRNSILCASISQKPTQLPKRSKVRCKEEEERIQIICKTQNRDLPPSGPFLQILSHITLENHLETIQPSLLEGQTLDVVTYRAGS